MANTKKTTTKKGSTAKKASSSKKSTTKAKSTPKKNNKKSSYVSSSTGKRVPFSEQYYNAIMLCYLLGGALMLALALIKGSNLWTGLRSVLFSAFGISFYLLTVQTIVIGVRMALHNLKRSLLVTNISGFLLSGSFAGIIHLIIADLNKRLADRELRIELTDSAGRFIVENGYDPVYGARPLKRYIQKYVETLAAKLILRDEVAGGDTILIDVSDDVLTAEKKN